MSKHHIPVSNCQKIPGTNGSENQSFGDAGILSPEDMLSSLCQERSPILALKPEVMAEEFCRKWFAHLKLP